MHPIFLAELMERLSSSKMVRAQVDVATMFDNKQEGLWPFTVEILRSQQQKGMWLEFGVLEGKSINWFSKHAKLNSADGKIYGFDSFEGLAEHYSIGTSSGNYQSKQGKLPSVNENVVIVPGWIDSTLEKFLQNRRGSISFVHLDFGTYEATRFVISKVKNRLADDAIILFDEFHGFTGWKEFEFKALNEELSEDEFRFVAFGKRQALIQLIKKHPIN